MDNDKEQGNWPEMLYRAFEERFSSGRVWRVPGTKLSETPLSSLLKEFAATFPDHANGENTVVYLVEAIQITPAMRTVMLACMDFEYSGLADIRSLVKFIERAGEVLTNRTEGTIELLDSIQERLVLAFFDPREQVSHILQDAGIEITTGKISSSKLGHDTPQRHR